MRQAWPSRRPADALQGGKHFVPEDHPERVATAVERVVAEAA